jgi:hypothetical protein
MRTASVLLIILLVGTVPAAAQGPIVIDTQIETRLVVAAGVTVGVPGAELAWLDVLHVERHAEPQDVIVDIITATRTITRRYPAALASDHRRLSIALHEDPQLVGAVVFSLLIDCSGRCAAAVSQRQAAAPWLQPVIIPATPTAAPTYTR